MSVVWLTPAAWWGLTALALPVLIHLLVRHRSRHLLFPSLRFLRATRLAALRHRMILDWPLLLVRMLILAAAVAALAGPVLTSERRQREWATRVARAIVVGQAPTLAAERRTRDETIDAERRESLTNAVFAERAHLADALREASIWLQHQPPASREIVVAGDVTDGALAWSDLRLIPRHVGIRFLPFPSATWNRVVELAHVRTIADPPRAHVTRVELLDDATTMDEGTATSSPGPLSVRAAAADQHIADAGLRAVYEEGIVLDRALARRVVVLFEGAEAADLQPLKRPPDAPWMRQALENLPDLEGGQNGERLVVRTRSRAMDAATVDVIARIARVAFAEDLGSLEPRRVSAATLAAWSRPPGPVPEDVRPADEGDRRWLWGAALLLLVVEHLLRRARRGPVAAASAAVEEARVA